MNYLKMTIHASVWIFVLLVILLIVAHLCERTPSPRSTLRLYRYWFWIVNMLWFAISCHALIMNHFYLLAIWPPMFLLSALPLVFRKRTAKEFLQNYTANSRYCGRCEYDLTGNITGICPECGWEIPDNDTLVQDYGWGRWWKKWNIGYLEQPRNNLLLCAFLSFLLLLAAWIIGDMAYSGLQHYSVTSVLLFMLACCCLHFTINAYRVLIYIRKQRHSYPDQASQRKSLPEPKDHERK